MLNALCSDTTRPSESSSVLHLGGGGASAYDSEPRYAPTVGSSAEERIRWSRLPSMPSGPMGSQVWKPEIMDLEN